MLLWKLKITLRDPPGTSETPMTFALQKVIPFCLVMVYDRVGDGDKHAYETLIGRPRFHATSHLKTEAKEFFM